MINGTKLIFIGNYKGGVGKTTTTFNLAYEFSKRDFKVLAIDLDPQSSLSEILISNNSDINKQRLRNIPNEKTINYVFDIYIKIIKNYNTFNPSFDNIQSDYNGLFDYIPSSMFYKYCKENSIGIGLDDIIMKMDDDIKYYSILPNFLMKFLNNIKYDFILFDCPPTNNIVTSSTFLLSDYYLIPTICDGLSSEGVVHYISKISRIYKEVCIESPNADLHKMLFGGEPECIGIFYNLIRQQVRYDEVKVELKSELTKQFANKKYDIFDGFINNYVDTARNTSKGVPSSNEFSKIADWVLSRII